MKKGISLIVLVITIIVMIIIAGAIIISLSQSNIITQAGVAKTEANLANAKAVVVATWADSAVQAADGKATLNEAAYYTALEAAGLKDANGQAETLYTVELPTETVDGQAVYTGGCPSVSAVTNP